MNVKQYKRYVTLFSGASVLKITLIVVGIVIVLGSLEGENVFFVIIAYGILPILIFQDILFIITDLHRYEYTEKVIRLKCFSVCYKNIEYKNIRSIMISNAGLVNAKGFHFPLYYKREGSDGKIEKIQYADIILFKEEIENQNLLKGIDNIHIRRKNILEKKYLYDLGICWFDSLIELALYTDAKIYILEEVYWRFQVEFDKIVKEGEADVERFYIVATKIIPYLAYKQMNYYA